MLFVNSLSSSFYSSSSLINVVILITPKANTKGINAENLTKQKKMNNFSFLRLKNFK